MFPLHCFLPEGVGPRGARLLIVEMIIIEINFNYYVLLVYNIDEKPVNFF